MNNKNIHHIVESINKLFHDDLNNTWTNFPWSQLHELFQVTSVTKLHKNVVSGVGFDSFSHLNHVLTLYWVLILDLGNYQRFFSFAKLSPLDYLACVKLWVLHLLQLLERLLSFGNCISTWLMCSVSILHQWRCFWDLLSQINLTILSLSKISVQIN